jgi:hypothetical protein
MTLVQTTVNDWIGPVNEQASVCKYQLGWFLGISPCTQSLCFSRLFSEGVSHAERDFESQELPG